MADENQTVQTSTVLFGEVCDAVDPMRQKENALGPIAYEFGAGRVLKRDKPNPYEPA